MSVARVTELSATSQISFDDAVKEAVARATRTLRGIEGAWIKDQNVLIEDGSITGYKVNLEVTFVLEEAARGSEHGATGETPQMGRTVPVEERPEAGGV
jgi:flavin-binding protein dodecin